MKRHRHTPSRCGGVGHTSIVTRVVRRMELSLGERAQVGAQRRRRPDRAEEPIHRAVMEQVEIVVDTAAPASIPPTTLALSRRGSASPRSIALGQQVVQSRAASASSSTGTSPDDETRFESSKTAWLCEVFALSRTPFAVTGFGP